MLCVYCHATLNGLGTVLGSFLDEFVYGFKNFFPLWNIQGGRDYLLVFLL